CRQRRDLAFDSHAFSDRVSNRVQDLSKVTAALMVDVDSSDHDVEGVAAGALNHLLEGVFWRESQTDLANDPSEFLCGWRWRLAGYEIHCLQQAEPTAQCVRHHHDRIGKLTVESLAAS